MKLWNPSRISWVSLGQFCLGLFPFEEEGCASQGGNAIPSIKLLDRIARSHPGKIKLISWGSMSFVSDNKLIRTDTILDLISKRPRKVCSLSQPFPHVADAACLHMATGPTPMVLTFYSKPLELHTKKQSQCKSKTNSPQKRQLAKQMRSSH